MLQMDKYTVEKGMKMSIILGKHMMTHQQVDPYFIIKLTLDQVVQIGQMTQVKQAQQMLEMMLLLAYLILMIATM